MKGWLILLYEIMCDSVCEMAYEFVFLSWDWWVGWGAREEERHSVE